MRTKIEIPVTKPYNLKATLNSHGWSQLLPNAIDRESGIFSRVERLSSGEVVRFIIPIDKDCSARNAIGVMVLHRRALNASEKDELHSSIAHMLRLEEDLTPFYAQCRSIGGKWMDFPEGEGYLLRSPSLFEDMVKVICTTNIQWGGTKRMVADLVNAYGAPCPDDDQYKSFPTAEDISTVSLDAFKESLRLGYRADYIHSIADGFVSGRIEETSYLDPNNSSTEIKKQLLSVKGIGNYAAASLMMLLGRYDSIPVDTVFRDYMRAVYFKDHAYSELEALQIFDRWGKWKYLAYWMELSRYYDGDH